MASRAQQDPSPMPPGSDRIARWAAANAFKYSPRPDPSWFQQWEPYDTIVSPTAYLNACMRSYHPGQRHVALVEPWVADEGFEPIDRTMLALVNHPALRWKVSARIGESFLTRVAFVSSPAPPAVKTGDEAWDQVANTFAWDQVHLTNGLTPKLRKLLLSWGFQGHLELRQGGLVLHVAGLHSAPEDLDRLLPFVHEVVSAAVA